MQQILELKSPKEKERLEKKLLHYTGKAIGDFNMIQKGDRILVCLSGGKDSFSLLTLLHKLRLKSKHRFELFSFTLDQSQPGWDDTALRSYLEAQQFPYTIFKEDTYSIVKEKIPEGQTYCSLCSRLRRGIIYNYAQKEGFNKIALGHHRDDLITTALMSMMYSGETRSMPPKLLSDNRQHIVIRPLAYCQESDLARYAQLKNYPIIPCNLCGSQDNLIRKKVKNMIYSLAQDHPKIPSNLLNAIGQVKVSQLMDQNLWDFKNLEEGLKPVL